MTLAEMRTIVKDLITHNVTGIDTTVDTALNTAIELITQNVSAIYDEDIWYHQFTSTDVSNNYDNFPLPSNTKYIRKVAYRDVTGTEDTYKELTALSPDEIYRYSAVDADTRGFVNMGGYDFTGADNMRDFAQSRAVFPTTRVDAEGEPRMFYRLKNQLFVHPRPSTSEVGNYIEAFIHKYCAYLSADGDTNTISINYPYSCIHYAVGILWATKFNNMQRAQASIQLGASMLQAVATSQEVSKLINMITKIA